MSPAPDWLHIGSGKSGSTSLSVYLAQHPQLFVSPVKEPRHFLSPGVRPSFTGPSDEERVNQSLVWDPEAYRQLFDGRSEGQLAGELSQTYLGWPSAPAAVRAHNPDARMLAVLRHPAERAFSSWAAHRRDGFERVTSFEEALAQEEQRLADGWGPIWAYTERGRYADALTRWYEHFPPDQIRVWLYEDLRSDLDGLLRGAFEFLGVDPAFRPSTDKQHNVSLVPRSQRLSRFVTVRSGPRRMAGKLVPPRWRAPVARRVIGLNQRRLTFDPATRRELTERFRPDIERLQELLGRDLSAWLESSP